MLALACFVFLGIQIYRAADFARESRDFDAVLAAAVPGQLALSMVFDEASAAAHNGSAYRHFPAWYQAEKSGWVEFNFAMFLPQIVRYRPEQIPAHGWSQVMEPGAFDWDILAAQRYRYFFVRGAKSAPRALLDNPDCCVGLLLSAGTWSVYEARQCRWRSAGRPSE